MIEVCPDYLVFSVPKETLAFLRNMALFNETTFYKVYFYVETAVDIGTYTASEYRTNLTRHIHEQTKEHKTRNDNHK